MSDATSMLAPVIAIVGATATGKSAVAIDVAAQVNAEVVNCDSMQFYRGMDIGTAKVPLEERRGVPHHQLDTLDVHEDASVASFQQDARADVHDILNRGKRAIVVGGSGLYLRSLVDAFEFPATDPEVRRALEERAEVEGTGVLYRELASVDPVAASKIDPKNTKRVVRALEVFQITGEPFGGGLPAYTYYLPTIQIGLKLDLDTLDERIAKRVDLMWEQGLVDEVKRLDSQGIRTGVTAQRAVGYAETLRHLDGELSERETRDLIAQNTRRLARRQQRWFGPDPRIVWVDAPGEIADVPQLAQRIVQEFL